MTTTNEVETATVANGDVVRAGDYIEWIYQLAPAGPRSVFCAVTSISRDPHFHGLRRVHAITITGNSPGARQGFASDQVIRKVKASEFPANAMHASERPWDHYHSIEGHRQNSACDGEPWCRRISEDQYSADEVLECGCNAHAVVDLSAKHGRECALLGDTFKITVEITLPPESYPGTVNYVIEDIKKLLSGLQPELARYCVDDGELQQ